MIKNNSIQRFTALLISFVMVLSLAIVMPVSVSAADTTTSAEPSEAALLRAVGIISDKGITTEMMSRADFVVYAARVIGINDLQQSNTRYFYDVPMEHYAVGAINKFVDMKILSVDDKKEFRPDETITYSEAAKILVAALGYDELAKVYGGYPSGYNMMAKRIGLADGVSDGELTANAAIRMLYNALKADVEEVIAIKDNGIVKKADGETVLSIYHNIAFAEGPITAAHGMTMYSDIEPEDNEVYIDEEKLYTDIDLSGLFGSYVEYYYKKDNSSNKKTIVYAEEKSDTPLVISIKDFESYYDGTIKYVKGDKEATVTTASNRVVVYNGRPVDGDPKAIFDNLNYGSITVKSSDNSNDNVILIDDYTDMYVSGISEKKETISDNTLSSSSLDIAKADYLVFKNAAGSEIKYTDIPLKSLLCVKKSLDNKYIYAEISEGVASGKIKTVYTRDDVKHIVVEETDYVLTKTCESMFNISAGMSYKFFLNRENDVAYIDLSGATNLEPGYVVNAIVSDDLFSNCVKFRIVDTTGKRVVLETADKVKIDGVTYNDPAKMLAAFPSDSNVVGTVEPQLIMYNTADGKIIEIDTYGGDPTKEDKKTTLDRKVVDSDGIMYGETNFNSNRFGHNTLVRPGGKLFTVPDNDELNSAPDRKFKCETTSQTVFGAFDSGGGNIVFYRMGTDESYWDYLVHVGEAKASLDSGRMAVITDIYETMNADEEVVQALEVFEALETGGSKAEYEISENVKVTKVIGKVAGSVANDKKKEEKEISFSDLQKGDTVRYAYSGNIITDIELLYDESTNTLPTWAGVDENKSRYVNVEWYSENFQLSFGFVHSTKNDVLSWGYKTGETADEYWNLFISPNTYGSRMVIYDTDKEEAYVGNMTDLIDYETYGNSTELSRVILRTNLRAYRGMIAYI